MKDTIKHTLNDTIKDTEKRNLSIFDNILNSIPLSILGISESRASEKAKSLSSRECLNKN